MSYSSEYPGARCYNGCWDSKTQRIFDRQDAMLKRIREFEPRAIVTYFPVECEYVVHVCGRELSSYHQHKSSALEDALNRLEIKAAT